MASLKEFFENNYFEKNQQTTKKLEKNPSMQSVNRVSVAVHRTFPIISPFQSRATVTTHVQLVLFRENLAFLSFPGLGTARGFSRVPKFMFG